MPKIRCEIPVLVFPKVDLVIGDSVVKTFSFARQPIFVVSTLTPNPICVEPLNAMLNL